MNSQTEDTWRPVKHTQILVVEDELIIADDIRDTLTALGYSAPEAVVSGENAVRRAGELRPDLVLMDIKLRGAMDGIDAANRIRDHFDIPVIYMTAFSDDATLQRAKITGPFGYILKPVEERELHVAIEMALDRHRLESRLKASEKNLNKAQEIAHVGSWEWDVPADAITWSDEMYRIYGLEPGSTPTYEAVHELIHPDDTAIFDRTMADLSTGQASPDLEYRIIRSDGHVRFLKGNADIFHDESGHLLRIVGIVQDITEHKRAEDALRQSHERFVTVLDSLDAGVYVADMETYELLFVNKSVQGLFGTDLVGKMCWKTIQSGQHGPCDFCTNNRLLDANGEAADGYIWQIQNPILNRWYELRDQAIRWSDGRLARMEIAIDITERKQAE